MSDEARERPGSVVPTSAELERIAVRLAVQAGALVVSERAVGFEVDTKSSSTDVVTDVDTASETFIRAELGRLRPADRVLGEEAGEPDAADGSAPSAVRWVVDPIDGTVNFLLGLPQYAVSIAAQVDGVTVAGCVHNPVGGQVFRARRGGGAYLGDRRLGGPRHVRLAEAVVATGFGYDNTYRAAQGEVVGRLLGRIGNLRRIGSAALDLCAVAAGWVDFYYEGPLGEWDCAAGLLIAEEAGAATSGLDGYPAGPDFVAAGHPAGVSEFYDLLAELGAARLARDFASASALNRTPAHTADGRSQQRLDAASSAD